MHLKNADEQTVHLDNIDIDILEEVKNDGNIGPNESFQVVSESYQEN